MTSRKVSPFFASMSEKPVRSLKLKAEKKVVESLPALATFSRFPSQPEPPEQDRMQVNKLRQIKKIEQRTDEWYAARKTMITASDWADALNQGKGGGKEDIILKKCDKGPAFTGNVFTEWGVKYEPVATRMYEIRNHTPVYEFGVLRHPIYSFLGASPDGITPKGVMLEIKCPYKRKITGVVPSYYWTQVQGQLEVCDLEICDFLECKIVEYPNQDAYLQDSKREVFPVFDELKEKYESGDILLRTKDGFDKGVVLTYCLPDGSKKYTYSELGVSEREFKRWFEEQKKENASWKALSVTVTYWRFEFFSCVRISRDRKWFEEACPKLTEVWNEIEHYRNVGCDSILAKKGRIEPEPSEEMIQEALQDPCGLDDMVSGFLSEKIPSPPIKSEKKMEKSTDDVSDVLEVDIEHLANLDMASQHLPNYLPTELNPTQKDTIVRAEISLFAMAHLVRNAVVSHSKLKGTSWKKILPELPMKIQRFHSWMKGIPTLLRDYEEAYKKHLSEKAIEKLENTIVFAETWLSNNSGKSSPEEEDS